MATKTSALIHFVDCERIRRELLEEIERKRTGPVTDPCWQWAPPYIQQHQHELLPWSKNWLEDAIERSKFGGKTYEEAVQEAMARADECNAPSKPLAAKDGMRVVVQARMKGRFGSRPDSARGGDSKREARLTVPFSRPSSSPGSGNQPPSTECPTIPFVVLHKMDKLGINYYPQNTVVEFTTQPTTYLDGIGPWEGGKVIIDWSPSLALHYLRYFFRHEVRVRSEKVFEHWASIKAISDPAPPASIVERSEPFNPELLQVRTFVPYDPDAPEGMRGQGWRIFVEYTHVESGRTWVLEQWLESDIGWNPVGLGGYSVDQIFTHYFPDVVDFDGEVEGTWVHRVCVYDFKRMPTPVDVFYNGVHIGNGFSSISPVMTTPYVPGVSTGIAIVEETFTVYTVGESKASFRILNVEPVPGFGVRFTIKVINQLHFPACIVTPFLTSVVTEHFHMRDVWVVRNLDAHSESEPISILVPIDIVEPGDWPLLARHWMHANATAYPAPMNQVPDGIYGFHPDSIFYKLPNWPPAGYKISNNPERYAELLAGYLENGDKVWKESSAYGDPDRLLMTIPLRKAPGAEVPYVRVPPLSNDTYPTYFDQVPFLGVFEWTAEYRVATSPEVWETRSGIATLRLDLGTAIARYGRYMTLPVAEGRPMWSPYYQKWIAVFETWPGGDVNELETYLVDTHLRPVYSDERGWRNFQYTTIKPPYLMVNGWAWFENFKIIDQENYPDVFILAKESSSADTVDVVLFGHG